MKTMMRTLTCLLALALCGAGFAWAEEAVTEFVEEAGTEAAFELNGPEEEYEGPAMVVEAAEEPLDGETEIVLTAASATLGVGEELSLLPEDWTGDLPTFTTSNKKIAAVSAAGVVEAKKKGSATITAVLNGATATCAIKVLKAPRSVSLGVSSVRLGYDAALPLGERFTLQPTLSRDSASRIAYRGYDSAIVAMEGNDIVAVGPGTTRVTAETCNGKHATVTVTVLPAPESIHFDADSLTISAGDSVALKAMLSEGSASTLSYGSNEPSVARVDENGKLTAVGQGDAVITATCFNGVSATCTVTVLPAPTKIDVEPASLTLGVGEVSAPLSAITDTGAQSGFTFTSSKPRVAEVSADGVVKGVKKGSATITVRTGRVSATVKVTVKAAPKSIDVSPKTLTLGFDAAGGIGEQAVLKAKLSRDSASVLECRGYDPQVVTVDKDGTVKAVGCGSTTITVATFNGRTDTVSVNVVPGPERLTLDAEQLTLGVKQTCALKANAEGGTASTLTFESDDPNCVKVDGNGKLTAVGTGNARVTVSAFNGVSAACAVTVVPEPTRVTVTPASLTLAVGEESAPLQAETDVTGMAQTFEFSTSKRKYATVNDSGVVKGVKKGSATIMVTAYNGVSAGVKVTVLEAPRSVTISPRTLALALNDSATVTASLPRGSGGAVAFKSEDESVVTVDADGRVTAVGYGTAKLTARTFNGRTDVCTVTVVAPAAQIVVPETLDAVTATYTDFPVQIIDAAGGDYHGSYEVAFEPEDIATIEKGRVLGLSEGQTTLTVTAGEISARCVVNVASYKSVHGVLSIAHRGGCGHKPENTLEAFRNARSLGADGVELDARSTRDGYQVIHHDATFKVNGKKYTVEKLKLSELRRLKPSVPTLDEALEVLDQEGVKIHLELKETADGAKCVKAVKEHGLEDRTIYFSFYDKQLKQVYNADHTVTLGKSLKAEEIYNSSAIASKIKSLHLSFLVANVQTMTREIVDYWHRQGIKLSIWTPNTRSEVKAMCDLGVDYILSDYPEYIVEYR